MIATYLLAAALALFILAAVFSRSKRGSRYLSREVKSTLDSDHKQFDYSLMQAGIPNQNGTSSDRHPESATVRDQPLVLIVDDGKALRSLMAEMLQEEGYCVQQASTGKEAIAKWQKERPDCVLLDLRLPDMSGIHVLSALREASDPAPVALMTAFADADIMAEARELVFHCLLEKPFDLLQVKQAVRDMTGGIHHREIS